MKTESLFFNRENSKIVTDFFLYSVYFFYICLFVSLLTEWLLRQSLLDESRNKTLTGLLLFLLHSHLQGEPLPEHLSSMGGHGSERTNNVSCSGMEGGSEKRKCCEKHLYKADLGSKEVQFCFPLFRFDSLHHISYITKTSVVIVTSSKDNFRRKLRLTIQRVLIVCTHQNDRCPSSCICH